MKKTQGDKMGRVIFTMGNRHIKLLKDLSKKLGITDSDTVRRSIEFYDYNVRENPTLTSSPKGTKTKEFKPGSMLQQISERKEKSRLNEEDFPKR